MEFDLQMIETPNARLRVVLAGTGRLLVLIHGCPEGWYSWRHQIRALASAGYRVAAPDVRGYGGSDKPYAIEAYAIREMCGDVAGLIDALGGGQSVVVGHDWGAAIAYWTGLFHPDRVSAVAGLSVPHLGRGPMPFVELLRQTYRERFSYQLYFQEPGVAEAELEADIRTTLRKMYYAYSGEGQKSNAKVENPSGPGLLDRLVAPEQLPPWLTEADLDYCTSQFRDSGFRGPLNRYRTSEPDFAQLAAFDGKRITQPAAFLAGRLDAILRMFPGVDMVDLMRAQFEDLRTVALFDDAGHWLQQERPAEINATLLAFLRGLSAG